MGIGVDTLGTLGSFVSMTFRAPLTGRLPHLPAAVNAVETGGARGLFIPTGADDRWIYAVQSDRAALDGAAWSPARWTALLRTATGMPDLRPDLLGVQSFEMAGQVARAFRAGRVFLTGDAAHRMTPVGGTGMNTAIHAAQPRLEAGLRPARLGGTGPAGDL